MTRAGAVHLFAFICIYLHLSASDYWTIFPSNFITICITTFYKLVEVAGVEPVRIVHLFALICICLHLSLLISTLTI